MRKFGLQAHLRDKRVETSCKQVNAFLKALRRISGAIFAAGLPENTTLSDALSQLHAMSVPRPDKHHRDGAKQRAG